MNNEQVIAVAKAVKDKVSKAAGKEIEPGRYDVDLLVRVLGSFSKGEDFDQKLPAKINFTLLACLALSKVNKTTRDGIVNYYLLGHGAYAAQKRSGNY